MSEITVLLVDDEAAFVDAMSRRLTHRQFNVITASDGHAALELLDSAKGSRVDVAVLDVRMPGMNGLELLAAIRRGHPMVESIMLTGHATVETAIEGMKQGAYDYLMKPCDIKVLDEKIKAAYEVKRGREARIIEANAELIALRRGD